MSDDYGLIPRTADMPAGADFCFIMDNSSMEPVIQKGERVYVSRHESPGEMEAGLFLYRGRVYCRQFCEDYAGRLHLLCANPGAEKENLCLDSAEKEHCLCIGKVLGKAKLPMPLYF